MSQNTAGAPSRPHKRPRVASSSSTSGTASSSSSAVSATSASAASGSVAPSAPGTGAVSSPRFVECDEQGAEGRIFVRPFLTGRFARKAVVKERFAKTYRHPDLDMKLRHARMVHEARCLVRCARAGIDVPQVYFVDERAMSLHLEFIDGWTVKEYLRRHEGGATWDAVADAMGAAVAKIHDAGIVHGDLTTSNMMIRKHPRGGSSKADDCSAAVSTPDAALCVTLIDFGLGAQSAANPEDRAVDLYVLERAMASTHPGSDVRLVPRVMEAYRRTCRSGHYQTMEKLAQVRLRGRKRLAFG